MDSESIRKDHQIALISVATLLALLLFPGGHLHPEPGRFSFLFFEGIDKLAHLVLFYLQSWFLYRSFRHRGPAAKPWLITLGAVLVLGIVSELLQGPIPGRSADPIDFLADGTGAFLWLAFGPRQPLPKTDENPNASTSGRLNGAVTPRSSAQ